MSAQIVNGEHACAVVIRKVPTLAHELWDNTMKAGKCVSRPRLLLGQLQEVLCCFRGDVLFQLHNNAPKRHSITVPPQLHFEEYKRVLLQGNCERFSSMTRLYSLPARSASQVCLHMCSQ